MSKPGKQLKENENLKIGQKHGDEGANCGDSSDEDHRDRKSMHYQTKSNYK